MTGTLRECVETPSTQRQGDTERERERREREREREREVAPQTKHKQRTCGFVDGVVSPYRLRGILF